MADDAREDLTVLLAEARLGRHRGPGAADAGGLRRAETDGRRPDAARAARPHAPAQALVNEAIVRLFEGEALDRASDRRYLFAAAAQAMRQVLVDHARRRDAAKRDGGRHRVPLDQVLPILRRAPA